MFLPLVHDLSNHQKQIGLETLYDCCWTLNRSELSTYWRQRYREPEASSNSLSILHYNMRSFYSNQADLTEMTNDNSPTIISLNELGTSVPTKTINQLLFSYNVYYKEGTNPHGGVVLAVDKRLKTQLLKINEPNVIAVQTVISDQHFVIASIYSPPAEHLPITVMTTLLSKSKNIIITGDFNAKHPDWGCPQVNTKGHVLAEWIKDQNLNVHNFGLKTSLRSDTTIDLILSTEEPETTESYSLAYTGSDHLPVFTKFFNLSTSTDNLLVPRTYWKLFQIILIVLHDQLQAEQEILMNNSSNAFNWFITFENFLAALKLRVTVWQEIKRKRPSISPTLRILLRHKHYLQNKYRHTKYEEDRVRLRSWNTLVKQELQAHRQRSWEQFISNVASPNPSSFWQTVKKLNKKKTVDVTALTEEKKIHKTPENIVNCLNHHFTERHSQPLLDMKKPIDKEANDTWMLYSSADTDDIRLVTKHSDLQYTEQDIKTSIRSLKDKNSSGFDRVSNRMIKLLPSKYYSLLTHAYNELFQTAYWGEEWKIARTICLNKSDDPAPRTNQLRPISILPAFSKIYEKLFLIRFKNWAQKMNVLPPQQSGARPHQATTTRVNCLLEQIDQSLSVNSFTPVVYVDFLQAFDMLWQQGLLLKLNRLNCPVAYLVWIANYFSERTLRIDYEGVQSALIKVQRGAPQGSVLGPVMYVISHHDLPLCFGNPTQVHAYVDDVAIAYTPSFYLKTKSQIAEIEERINMDMEKLSNYSIDWHQPLNPRKLSLWYTTNQFITLNSIYYMMEKKLHKRRVSNTWVSIWMQNSLFEI